MNDEEQRLVGQEEKCDRVALHLDRTDIRHSSLITHHSSSPIPHFLLLLVGLFAFSGAGCPRMLQQYTNPLPRVLPQSPTLEQVIDAVNRNSSQIRSFSTNRASISGPDFPSVTASIAFERAERFRLKAGGLTGTEVDLGSNDELFWFWVRRNQPPAMYFCRHDQFAALQGRQILPFEPAWLIEMLGVMEFDPALPHQGPYPQPDGRLRIDTIRDTPEGPVKKITFVDASQGWVLAQYQYDAQRRLVASCVATGHRQDPLSGLVMPTVVTLNFPATGMAMRIDLGNVEINRLPGDPAQLWSMPTYPNTPLVDLGDPRSMPPVAASTPVSRTNRRDVSR